MSIRFAPARTPACSPVVRVLQYGCVKSAANDTGKEGTLSDCTKVALRHFAEHGLRAVPAALDNAARAAAAMHEADYRHWLAIARELDAGAAARFEAMRRTDKDRLIG